MCSVTTSIALSNSGPLPRDLTTRKLTNESQMVDRSLVAIARRPGRFDELSVLCAGFRVSPLLHSLSYFLRKG